MRHVPLIRFTQTPLTFMMMITEINDGMCTPRGGRRVDESYVPSSSEKIDLLTDRMNAMQGQLSNIERLLAQVPGVKAE